VFPLLILSTLLLILAAYPERAALGADAPVAPNIDEAGLPTLRALGLTLNILDNATRQPSPATVQDQAPVVEVVTLVNLNLRAGPATTYTVQRVLSAGEHLSVLAKTPLADWVQVRTMTGQGGWVATNYVTPVAPQIKPAMTIYAPGPAPGGAVPVSAVTSKPTSTVSVTALGDSIMLGASGALRQVIGNIVIDAVVSRQVSGVISALSAKRAAGQLGTTILIHIGTNGTFTAAQFDEIMNLAGGRRVVFVNIKVPRGWEGPNNSLLASKVRQYPNATLVDWYSASAGRADFFAGDGIHLSANGIRAYTALIASRLGG
jgi:hypothetical protein